MEKYNCFECKDPNNTLCEGYTELKEKGCAWKKVAENDFKKYQEEKLVYYFNIYVKNLFE